MQRQMAVTHIVYFMLCRSSLLSTAISFVSGPSEAIKKHGHRQLKSSWGSGGAVSPLVGPGQSPGGGSGGKPPKAPGILCFNNPETAFS